jgi:hypothetical protein
MTTDQIESVRGVIFKLSSIGGPMDPRFEEQVRIAWMNILCMTYERDFDPSVRDYLRRKAQYQCASVRIERMAGAIDSTIAHLKTLVVDASPMIANILTQLETLPRPCWYGSERDHVVTPPFGESTAPREACDGCGIVHEWRAAYVAEKWTNAAGERRAWNGKFCERCYWQIHAIRRADWSLYPVKNFDAVRIGCHVFDCGMWAVSWCDICDWLAECPPVFDIETFWVIADGERHLLITGVERS